MSARFERLESRIVLAAPQVDLGVFSIPERSPEDAQVGSVQASGGVAPLRFEITGGNTDVDNDQDLAFKIDRLAGTLRVNDPDDLNFSIQSTFVLTVSATDARGETGSKSQIIFLADRNDPPEFGELAPLHVGEHASPNTSLGFLFAADSDGDMLTYELTGVGNPDGADEDQTAAFALDPQSGELTVADPDELNHEAQAEYQVEVRVTDSSPDQFSDSTLLTIVVDDENDRPILLDQAFTIPEGSHEGFVVGLVDAADEDVVETLAFELDFNLEHDVDGDGAAPFAISPDGNLTVSDRDDLNYEVRNQFELTVSVTDSGLATDSATVTVLLSDVPEDVLELADRTFRVVDRQASGSPIGDISVPHVDGQFVYTITGGNPDLNSINGPAISIDPQTGELSVNDSDDLDHEGVGQFHMSVRVTVTDGPWEPLFADATITIIVDEPIVFLSDHVDFASALSAIHPASSTRLIVDEHYALRDNVEIPENVTLEIINSGGLILGNFELTIRGRFETDQTSVFWQAGNASTGQVVFQSGSTDALRTRWWAGSDTEIIEKSLLSAAASDVKRVHLDGRFTVEHNIRIDSSIYSGIAIAGEGATTVVSPSPTSVGILTFEIDGRDTRIEDLTFEDFVLDGGNAFGSQGLYTWHGLDGNGIFGMKVQRMTARHFGKVGFYFGGNIEGKQLLSHNNGIHGFVARDGYVTLDDVVATQNDGIGLDVAGGRDGFATVAHVSHFLFYENALFGAKAGIRTGSDITSHYTDGVFRDNGDNGFTLTFSADVVDFSKIHTSMTRVTASGNGWTGLQMKAGTARLIDIVADSNANAGVSLTGTMTVGDNISASGNGQMGIFADDCQLSNVRSTGNQAEGIRLIGDCHMSHVTVTDNGEFGILAIGSDSTLRQVDFGESSEAQPFQMGVLQDSNIFVQDELPPMVHVDGTSALRRLSYADPLGPRIVPALRPLISTPGAASVSTQIRGIDGTGRRVEVFDIEVTTVEASLAEEFDFFLSGTDYFNALGAAEKWVRSASDGHWYFILPTNELFRWDRSPTASGTFIAQLTEGIHADPALLTDAQVPATAVVEDGLLTITRQPGFTGSVSVTMLIQDGDESHEQHLQVWFS